MKLPVDVLTSTVVSSRVDMGDYIQQEQMELIHYLRSNFILCILVMGKKSHEISFYMGQSYNPKLTNVAQNGIKLLIYFETMHDQWFCRTDVRCFNQLWPVRKQQLYSRCSCGPRYAWKSLIQNGFQSCRNRTPFHLYLTNVIHPYMNETHRML